MQRVTFTREAILGAAYQLTREGGWSAVTSRSIAKRLGSSTMPIYSTTRSMSEIEQEVRRRAEALLLDYQSRRVTADIALDKAIGYVAFARDEKNLFRFLYVDRPLVSKGNSAGGSEPARGTPADGVPVDRGAKGGLRSDEGSAEAPVSLEELTTTAALPTLEAQARVAMQDRRILKSWVFTHGLASLIAAGVLSLRDEEVRSLLLEAGTSLLHSDK